MFDPAISVELASCLPLTISRTLLPWHAYISSFFFHRLAYPYQSQITSYPTASLLRRDLSLQLTEAVLALASFYPPLCLSLSRAHPLASPPIPVVELHLSLRSSPFVFVGLSYRYLLHYPPLPPAAASAANQSVAVGLAVPYSVLCDVPGSSPDIQIQQEPFLLFAAIPPSALSLLLRSERPSLPLHFSSRPHSTSSTSTTSLNIHPPHLANVWMF